MRLNESPTYRPLFRPPAPQSPSCLSWRAALQQLPHYPPPGALHSYSLCTRPPWSHLGRIIIELIQVSYISKFPTSSSHASRTLFSCLDMCISFVVVLHVPPGHSHPCRTLLSTHTHSSTALLFPLHPSLGAKLGIYVIIPVFRQRLGLSISLYMYVFGRLRCQ